MKEGVMNRMLIGLLLVLVVPVTAQEKLTLTTPVASSITEWSIASFAIDVEAGSLRIGLKDNNGARRFIGYPNATTTAAQTLALIDALNTANLSTKSLRRRILERLQADGFLGAGTFSGGN
jgi:hypothetical protein